MRLVWLLKASANICLQNFSEQQTLNKPKLRVRSMWAMSRQASMNTTLRPFLHPAEKWSISRSQAMLKIDMRSLSSPPSKLLKKPKICQVPSSEIVSSKLAGPTIQSRELGGCLAKRTLQKLLRRRTKLLLHYKPFLRRCRQAIRRQAEAGAKVNLEARDQDPVLATDPEGTVLAVAVAETEDGVTERGAVAGAEAETGVGIETETETDGAIEIARAVEAAVTAGQEGEVGRHPKNQRKFVTLERKGCSGMAFSGYLKRTLPSKLQLLSVIHLAPQV
mmetsp:Transcript_47945/g.94148  ORF Transcript_47945/g.94148 Transcript_47945/m.94148 type:complete len:277 (+) Transcript_47945:219-1049(+)